jgi:hypothetical protein
MESGFPRQATPTSNVAIRRRRFLGSGKWPALRRPPSAKSTPVPDSPALALSGISAGTVEGFNGKAKLTTRKAYAFRTPEGIGFALLHVMGNLPEAEFTHRFC